MIEQMRDMAGESRLTRAVVKKLASREPGDCCTQFWHDLKQPFPKNVSYMSIWSRIDGVVNPKACHDPAARMLEVRSSHCGMAFNRHVFRAVLEELTDVAASEGSGERRLAAA